jgi:FAD/FMN-containing dehydrogenase
VRAPPGLRGEFRTDAIARALYAEGAGIFRILPQAVAVPSDRQDLALLLRWADAEGVGLVPRGAGSGMPGGNVGPGVVVDLTRACLETPLIDVEGRSARCGASVTYRDLNAAAQPYGLHLPPDPSSGAFGRVGGMVATNAAGSHSVKYGAMRAWVRGLEFLTAGGEAGRTDPRTRGRTAAEERFLRDVAPAITAHADDLAAAAPRTTKNSSGYALVDYARSGRMADLLTGSEGTLAVVTAVELALAPLPAHRTTLLVTLRSLDDAAAAVLALQPTGPSAVELLDRTYLDFVRGAVRRQLPEGTEAVLLVDFEGDAAAGAAAIAGLAQTTELADDAASVSRLWELRHLASPLLAGLPDNLRSLQVIEDGCVPIDRLGRYIASLRTAAADEGFQIVIFGHAGDGHLHANLLADITNQDLAPRLAACLERVTAEQLALGGTPAGEHGDGRLRAPFLARTFGREYAELCRRTKVAWDPSGVLNPGVKVLSDGEAAAVDGRSLKVGAGAPPLPDRIGERLREIERTAGWGRFKLELASPAAPAARR